MRITHRIPTFVTALGLTLATLVLPSPGQAVEAPAEILIDPAGNPFGSFGREVQVQGDHMLIGANGADNQGAVFALRKNGTDWIPAQKFTGSTTAQGDFFGFTIDLDGDQVAVGAQQDDDMGSQSGSVFLFEWDGNAWNETATIVAPDGDDQDRFGSAIALSGDLLIVGSSADEPGGVTFAGSVYTFLKVSGTWTFEQKFSGSQVSDGDQFGWDVDTDGEVIIVSAIEDGIGALDTGVLSAFERVGGVWTEVQRFTAAGLGDGDNFGWDLDLENSRLAVGAPQHAGTGAVFLFERQGGVWVEADKVVSASTTAGDALGWSVDLQYPILVAGAPGKAGVPPSPAGQGDGAVFKWNFNGVQWADVNHWVSQDTNVTGFPLPQLGMSVALNGQTAIGGAPFANTTVASAAGKAYRFDSKPIGFEIETPTVIAGQNATLSIYGGQPNMPYGLALVGINGAPYPALIVTQANLDNEGQITIDAPSPISFAGLNLQLVAGALWQPGLIGISTQQTITIQ